MANITEISALPTAVIITPAASTTEFKIVEIHEYITLRQVTVIVELGPFVTDTGPDLTPILRGVNRRSVIIWDSVEYDAVRDTWSNKELLSKLSEVLTS